MNILELREKYVKILEEKCFSHLGILVKFIFDDKGHLCLSERSVDIDKNFILDNFDKEECRFALEKMVGLKFCGGDDYPFYIDINIDRDWLHENDMNWDSYLFLDKVLMEPLSAIYSEYLKEELNLFAMQNRDKSFSETIPSKLMTNLKIKGDLSGVRDWRAKVVIGNSLGENSPRVGQWDEVGYVLVGVKNMNLIPIARGDEHHLGQDLCFDYIQEGSIPDDIYIPLWNGINYIDNIEDESYILQYKRAVQLWLQFGGANNVVKFSRGGIKLDFKTFVNRADNLKEFIETLSDENSGTLFPIGKQIIFLLKALAKDFNRIHLSQKVKESNIYDNALHLAQLTEATFFDTNIMESAQKIRLAEAALDLKSVEEAVFSFNGIKNTLHLLLKKANEEKVNKYTLEEMVAVFGDVRLALEKFDIISGI